jgi:acetoin utilization protein AcuB
MKALDLITDEIPPIKPSEECIKAFNWMDEFKISHLPVVKNGVFYGVISDANVLDLEDPDVSIESAYPSLPRPHVTQDQHVYEVMKLIADNGLTVVPILDKEEKYLGSTTLLHLMRQITSTVSVNQDGGVLILQMNQIDYSLAQIAQIVEGNDAKILSSNITSLPDSTLMEVTLKINKKDLSGIIQTFNRFEYIVSAAFQESTYEEDMRLRYEALMKYLNM